MYKKIEIPKLNKGYYCYYFYKDCVSQATVDLYRIEALVTRHSPALQPANSVPPLPPASVSTQVLSEAKKATDTSGVLHLLGNPPASKPPLQVNARVPHGVSLLSSNTQVQHPGD